MKKDAVLSEDRVYRYMLSRVWDETKATVLFIGLNPSTADEVQDDPTVKRCINFAKSWGYGGVVMANLFAYRTSRPIELKSAKDPIGKDNDKWLKKLAKESDIVICAWGNHGHFQNRGNTVKAMLDKLYYLSLNQSGEPAHPLYLKSTLYPKKFEISL